MRIALDFDGVIGHTMDLWVDEYNRRHTSKKVSIADVTSWAFFEKPPFEITSDEAFDIFDFCWRHWEQIKPIEVDQDFKVEQLKKYGKVDVVSAVVKNKDSIRKWLTEHNIQVDEIVFSSEKWNLDYDVFIDDSSTNAEHIRKLGKTCLLYDELWNRDVKTNGKVIRVYNLHHACEMLEKINEKRQSG